MATREFDVVLYGATGFVGRQTVAYFGGNRPVRQERFKGASILMVGHSQQVGLDIHAHYLQTNK